MDMVESFHACHVSDGFWIGECRRGGDPSLCGSSLGIGPRDLDENVSLVLLPFLLQRHSGPISVFVLRNFVHTRISCCPDSE